MSGLQPVRWLGGSVTRTMWASSSGWRLPSSSVNTIHPWLQSLSSRQVSKSWVQKDALPSHCCLSLQNPEQHCEPLVQGLPPERQVEAPPLMSRHEPVVPQAPLQQAVPGSQSAPSAIQLSCPQTLSMQLPVQHSKLSRHALPATEHWFEFFAQVPVLGSHTPEQQSPARSQEPV